MAITIKHGANLITLTADQIEKLYADRAFLMDSVLTLINPEAADRSDLPFDLALTRQMIEEFFNEEPRGYSQEFINTIFAAPKENGPRLLTKLPAEIKTIEAARAFLSELNKNGEAYHPEDDAHEVDFLNLDEDSRPTDHERDQLNKLMADIYALPGNENPPHLTFDPCQYLLDDLKTFVVKDTSGRGYNTTATLADLKIWAEVIEADEAVNEFNRLEDATEYTASEELDILEVGDTYNLGTVKITRTK